MTDNLTVDPGNRFRGHSEHSLDGKGRLNIPTRFREVLREKYDERLMVFPWQKCLKAYPVPQWIEMENKLILRLETNTDMTSDTKKMIRYIIGCVVECPLDKQGRILLPPKLREDGGISKEVMIAGALTHFEITDKKTWETVNKPSAAEYENFNSSGTGLL